MNRKAAKALRAAAREIEREAESFSCTALFNTRGGAEVVQAYNALYAADACRWLWGAAVVDESHIPALAWNRGPDGERFHSAHEAIEQGRDQRILALCFAAAMAETGDL